MNRAGSICATVDAGGSLIIWKSHAPRERLVVERADIEDLVVAIDCAVSGLPDALDVRVMGNRTRAVLLLKLLDDPQFDFHEAGDSFRCDNAYERTEQAAIKLMERAQRMLVAREASEKARRR